MVPQQCGSDKMFCPALMRDQRTQNRRHQERRNTYLTDMLDSNAADIEFLSYVGRVSQRQRCIDSV